MTFTEHELSRLLSVCNDEGNGLMEVIKSMGFVQKDDMEKKRDKFFQDLEKKDDIIHHGWLKSNPLSIPSSCSTPKHLEIQEYYFSIDDAVKAASKKGYDIIIKTENGYSLRNLSDRDKWAPKVISVWKKKIDIKTHVKEMIVSNDITKRDDLDVVCGGVYNPQFILGMITQSLNINVCGTNGGWLWCLSKDEKDIVFESLHTNVPGFDKYEPERALVKKKTVKEPEPEDEEFDVEEVEIDGKKYYKDEKGNCV
jgi:hypothetical protein